MQTHSHSHFASPKHDNRRDAWDLDGRGSGKHVAKSNQPPSVCNADLSFFNTTPIV